MGDTWTRRRPPTRAIARTDLGLSFSLTDHALERFRERVCPAFSLAHARRELATLARSATRTAFRTRRGDEIWLATNGEPVQFIVRADHATGRVCTTVYGADEPHEGAHWVVLDDAGEVAT